MSAFTADDLKRLKDSLSTYEDDQQPCYRKMEFMALLARLEAAERTCEKAQQLIYDQGKKTANDMIHEFDEALNAWRKSCGL